MNYKIQSGDTLGALAKRFGTSVDALAKANRISDPNKIKAGAQLVVPDKFEQPQAHRAARDAQDGFEAHAPAQKPAQISEPMMPGRDATDAELAQYQKDLTAYAKTQPTTPADRSNLTAPSVPSADASLSEKARYLVNSQKYLTALEGSGLQAPANFTRPQMPSADATGRELMQYARDVRAYAASMKPAQISEPRMPGRDATDAELAQYEKDMAAYAKTLPITPADRSSVTAPAMPPVNASVADKVRYVADAQKYLVALEATGLRAPANFTKPPMPSADATLQELAQYTRNVRAYAAAMQ